MEKNNKSNETQFGNDRNKLGTAAGSSNPPSLAITMESSNKLINKTEKSMTSSIQIHGNRKELGAKKINANKNHQDNVDVDDDDDDDDDNNMTASYTEIAFHSNYLLNKEKLKKKTNLDERRNFGGEKKKLKNNLRNNSESGSSTKSSNDDDDDDDDDADDGDDISDDAIDGGRGQLGPAGCYNMNSKSKIFDDDKINDGKNKKSYLKNSRKCAAIATKRPISLICDNSFPYNLEGIVSKDGDMTNFVAENLEYKIKLSSPITKKEYPGLSSSRNSTPSTSGPISRQFLLSQQLQQIDSNVLNDIEIEAQYLAASVDSLTENLCNLLHSISSITADNVEVHKNAVNKLTDCMDANIKSMYTIMAKTEEISKSMKPTEQLAQRIREIKRLVEMFESNL